MKKKKFGALATLIKIKIVIRLTFLLTIGLALLAFFSYSSLEKEANRILQAYERLTSKPATSSGNFDKKLTFLSSVDGETKEELVFVTAQGTVMTGEEYENGLTNEHEDVVNEGVDTIGTDIDVPQDYWAYTKDVGISSNGEMSNVTVTVGEEQVNLWTGIPAAWNAGGESHIIFYDKVESSWRVGYEQAFGHDYPNQVYVGSWTNDSIKNVYSTISNESYRTKFNITDHANKISGKASYQRTTWHSDGVECIGFCPNPFMLSHEFKYNGTGSASAAYGYRYLLVLEMNGQFMYLPALGSDAMSHMWPGACYQTFVSHQNDNDPWSMPSSDGDYTADWANQVYTVSEALSRLESGNASPRHGTNKNNTVQYKIEGVRLPSLGSSGWKFYGVVCVK